MTKADTCSRSRAFVIILPWWEHGSKYGWELNTGLDLKNFAILARRK